MKRNKHIAPILLSLLTLFLVSCDREKELTFEDFDKDGDGVISHDEFEETFVSTYYHDWDHNDDPGLDDEDFYTSVYGVWDVDNDEYLTEEEWIMGYDYHYGDYVVTDFEVIDVDDDNMITYTEYYDVIDGTGFYGDWDLDSDLLIDEDELATSVFAAWDIDNDGVLDKEEYAAFDMHYLDI